MTNKKAYIKAAQDIFNGKAIFICPILENDISSYKEIMLFKPEKVGCQDAWFAYYNLNRKNYHRDDFNNNTLSVKEWRIMSLLIAAEMCE